LFSKGPENTFDWELFWEKAHCDRRFAPEGTEAIFFIFHFFGSLGARALEQKDMLLLESRQRPTKHFTLLAFVLVYGNLGIEFPVLFQLFQLEGFLSMDSR
jgi:hypothetical protein